MPSAKYPLSLLMVPDTKGFDVTLIHSSAVVNDRAKIGADVEIGPFSVIENHVEIGDGCRIAARVSIKSGTRLGPENRIHEGAILGGVPQHLKAGAQLGELVIGRGNTIREYATMHIGLSEGDRTQIGDGNMIMVGAHVGHDCHVGSHCIIINNVLLGGHVIVGDRAYVSGAVAIHQFCRIGAYAMVSGPARIIQDVPPYVAVDGSTSKIVGLNLIGLRRNGFDQEQIRELKAAYRVIYRSGLRWSEVLGELSRRYPNGPASLFYHFMSQGQRGFLRERRAQPLAALKIYKPVSDHDGNSESDSQVSSDSSSVLRQRAA